MKPNNFLICSPGEAAGSSHSLCRAQNKKVQGLAFKSFKHSAQEIKSSLGQMSSEFSLILHAMPPVVKASLIKTERVESCVGDRGILKNQIFKAHGFKFWSPVGGTVLEGSGTWVEVHK